MENVKGRVAWRCLCECGNEKICTTQLLRRGSVSSCGCLNSELASKRRSSDLIGERFGKLVVLEKSSVQNDGILWKCQCDCGNVTYATTKTLQQEGKVSCGCLRHVYDEKEIVKRSKKHRLKVTWRNMIQRCCNPKDSSYKNYGGRGIKVCDEWRNSFQSFYDWAIKNGYDKNKTRKEQSIDRIDNNSNYEPSNCRWTDAKTQANNKR